LVEKKDSYRTAGGDAEVSGVGGVLGLGQRDLKKGEGLLWTDTAEEDKRARVPNYPEAKRYSTVEEGKLAGGNGVPQGGRRFSAGRRNPNEKEKGGSL